MSKAKAPRVFVPLTKVDEEQRLVYGTITQELLDKAGEVMDYETSKPFFEKWSADIEAASGGLSKGNVRVMHGLTAAGKLTELNFDDESKSIDVCAKIVDDKEWEKVTEGVYTGFSVGGKYEKRWTDKGEDGSKIKKFTANPNEVSIVDNPCVPSACFTMFKADGAEEQIEFQVENDDDAWPDFAKADAPAEEEVEDKKPAAKKKDEKKPADKKAEKAAPAAASIPNNVLVKKAEELAKAAGDGTTWQDHLDAARTELTKDASSGVAQKNSEEGRDPKEVEEKDPTAEGAEDPEANESPDDAKAEKVTPSGVKQVWTASDGQTFDKKDDAVAHEAKLTKGEPTEADKLRARLEKATSTPVEAADQPIFSLGRIDELHKAVLELEQPRDEDGSPKLEKGMYTVSRFANMLGDVAGLARTIKAEGKLEEDATDESVWKTLQDQLSGFGESFMEYAKNQVAELVAGLDTDLSPRCAYDYYYRAAQENSEDTLAKNVVEMLTEAEEVKDEAIEGIEKLAKSVGFIGAELDSTDDDELSPALQKRFDALEEERNEFKKLATEAIEKIETLTKSVEDLGNKPEPRAPRNVVHREGDQGFFKGAGTEDEKRAMLHDFIKTHGAEGAALELIKASQASGGQKLHLNR